MKSIDTRPLRDKPKLDSPFYVCILVCLVAVVCYLAAMLGSALSLPRSLSPLWPGCAFVVAVLLCVPQRIWPILIAGGLAGFFVYDMQIGLTVGFTVLLLIADIVEILIAAFGVNNSLGGIPRLNSTKRIALYLLFAVILAPATGAFIGAIALRANYWTMWRISFFSEALALLTVTPAIVGWVNAVFRRRLKSIFYYLEAVALMAGLVVLAYFTFMASGSTSRPALLYSLVPFLLWSALRFGTVGTATSMLVVAFLSIRGTIHGQGPFLGSAQLSNVLSLQLFLLFAAIPFTVLASLVEEREKAAGALRESEARQRTKAKELETILEAVPVAVLIASDPKCERITANRAGCELLRLPHGANISKSSFRDEQPNFRIKEDGVEVPAEQLPIQRAAASGKQIFDVSESLVFEDGAGRSLVTNAAPLLGEDGRPYGAVAALLDVTERQQAEEARFRHAAIVESSDDAIISKNLDGVIMSWNAGAQHIFGYTEAEVVGKSITILIPTEIRDEENKIIERIKAGERIEHYETIRVTKTGKKVNVSLTISPVKDTTGRVVGASKIARDITERKRAEETLRTSEERFRLAAHAGKMFAYEWDLASDVIVRSAEAAQILGVDEGSETTGEQILAKVHPDDRERVMAAVAALAPEKPDLQISFRMVRMDGTIIWVERSSRAHFDEQGRMVRVIGMVADVTERKKAEQELKESEIRFRVVADTAPVLIWMSGDDKLCTYFNKPWLEFTGRVFEAELGNGWTQGVHPEDLPICLETYNQSFDRREPFRIEYRLRRHDGEHRWISDIGIPRFNADGGFAGFIGSAIDITDQMLAQEALRNVGGRLLEAQDQERCRIARELHDDISQKLALLSMEVVQANRNVNGSPEAMKAELTEIRQHCLDLAHDVQTLSHQLHNPRLDFLGIVGALRAFCKEFSKQYDVSIEFEDKYVPKNLPRNVSLCLFRVAQEALHNAVKYSGVKEFAVELNATADEVQLVVTDAGAGFDAEEAKRNLGLGLLSMQERVHLVHGRFHIESKPGQGTTIIASVPMRRDQRPSVPGAA